MDRVQFTSSLLHPRSVSVLLHVQVHGFLFLFLFSSSFSLCKVFIEIYCSWTFGYMTAGKSQDRLNFNQNAEPSDLQMRKQAGLKFPLSSPLFIIIFGDLLRFTW